MNLFESIEERKTENSERNLFYWVNKQLGFWGIFAYLG